MNDMYRYRKELGLIKRRRTLYLFMYYTGMIRVICEKRRLKLYEEANYYIRYRMFHPFVWIMILFGLIVSLMETFLKAISDLHEIYKNKYHLFRTLKCTGSNDRTERIKR